MKHLTLILGGCCSGKSKYALEYANQFGEKKTLLATAQALEEDMVVRIETQKKRRPADWTTLEESIKVPDVVGYLNRKADVVVVDSLDLWFSNLLMVESNYDLQKETNLFIDAIQRVDYAVVAVSGEVGSGIIPADLVSRTFRDNIGLLHQRLAAFSNEVFLMIAGIPTKIA